MNARLSDRIRQPAVAGTFYPGVPELLKATVEEQLASAPQVIKPDEALFGLIVPHAGYKYSGPVAAVAYKQLIGRSYQTVILMGPSHFAHFEGAAIPDVDAFATPLGEVDLSNKVTILAKKPPFAVNPPALVEPPQGRLSFWTTQPTPHTFEHCLEVQLPFLQTVLPSFEIVPIVFGAVDYEEAAEAIAAIWDEQTLIVASSDLSHYLPYRRAVEVDRRTLEAICQLDFRYLEGLRYQSRISPCGSTAILVLMWLARHLGWQPTLLDYRNSGDTSGDRSAVVGYAAVAFSRPSEEGHADDEQGPPEETSRGENGPESATPETGTLPNLTEEERQFLINLAWQTLRQFVFDRSLPKIPLEVVPPRLREPWACFVTLRRQGMLRGCIGTLTADQPLYLAVMENARNAARDPRFPILEDWELDDLSVEISILSKPRRLEYRTPEELLKKLRPGVDGVILQWHGARATFLPQVWEELPDPEQFLTHLSHKAGLPGDIWQHPETRIWTYQAEKIVEED